MIGRQNGQNHVMAILFKDENGIVGFGRGALGTPVLPPSLENFMEQLALIQPTLDLLYDMDLLEVDP
jgi:hypothetical protein